MIDTPDCICVLAARVVPDDAAPKPRPYTRLYKAPNWRAIGQVQRAKLINGNKLGYKRHSLEGMRYWQYYDIFGLGVEVLRQSCWGSTDDATVCHVTGTLEPCQTHHQDHPNWRATHTTLPTTTDASGQSGGPDENNTKKRQNDYYLD